MFTSYAPMFGSTKQKHSRYTDNIAILNKVHSDWIAKVQKFSRSKKKYHCSASHLKVFEKRRWRFPLELSEFWLYNEFLLCWKRHIAKTRRIDFFFTKYEPISYQKLKKITLINSFKRTFFGKLIEWNWKCLNFAQPPGPLSMVTN